MASFLFDEKRQDNQSMKIVSYNLRNRGNTRADNHWVQLLRQFEPDIVCAQESLHPGQYFPEDEFSTFKSCVHALVPQHRKWGSAIFSRKHVLEPVELPELNGWVVAAKAHGVIVGGRTQAVFVVSIHAPSPGPYLPVVSAVLDQVARVWDGTPLVICGDFNVTTALRHPSEAPMTNSLGERQLLTRLRREFGVVNAWQTMSPNENLPQTLRWTRNPATAYHCDGIFISHHFLPHLVSASIESAGEWATMSDHNPIVVSLEEGE
ncbi:endonuclease/exonuclease/phosphatase family protein [Variovorax humicola]|uniref:Endonuclease/exonuclease/phosphatase family protein n=1 Tax=Variovorax humicola TaxID=1769758 RepID=A0ABU8VVU2_9BURK